MRGQTFGLIEFAFAQLERMQRHRHDEIPAFPWHRRHRLAQEQSGQKRFKPERVGIFVTVDGFQHDGLGDHRRARGGKMQFQLVAIGALEGRRQFAVERQPAALAEGRADETDVRPALRTDQSAAWFGPPGVAELADFGINQAEPRLEPALKIFRHRRHAANLFHPAAAESKF